jgi:hypothetical protein
MKRLTIMLGLAVGLLATTDLSFAKLAWQDDVIEKPKAGKKSDAADKKRTAQGRVNFPRDIKEALDQTIIPMCQADRQAEAFEAIQTIVYRSTLEQLGEIENYCQAQGVVSIKKIFVDELIKRVQEGRMQLDSAVPYEQAVYISSGVSDYVERELSEVENFAFLNDNFVLPEDWRQAEQLFWDAHVINNRLTNIGSIAQFARTLVFDYYQLALKNDKQNRLPALEPLVGFPDKFAAEFYRFKTNDVFHHVTQLKFAAGRLKESTDFEDRLYAAYAVHDAETKIRDFYNEVPSTMVTRPEFLEKGYRDSLSQLVAQAKTDGVDVMDKAIRLRVGTHWWLRGRYGMAQMANGLLKVPEAMNNRDLMFGLYMPKKPDKPITRYLPEEETIKGYDRRHYYGWAVEYRPRVNSERSNVQRSVAFGPPKLTGNTFW